VSAKMARRGHLVPSSVPTSSSDPAPALTLRKEDKLAGHNGRVFDLQASVKDLSSSQPLRIAAVGEKGGSVWTFDGGARRHVRLPGTELMRVCWHPDGEHVLTGSAEGAICVRDASSGQTSATLQAAREDEVYGLEVLSEEGLLAAGAGETVQLWDLNRATRTSLAAFTATESGVHFGGLRNPDRKAFVFSIAARGRILSAALSDGSLRLLDSETLQELATLCVSNEAPALATAISPTSPLLACSDRAGGVLLWDLRQLGRGPLGETESSGGGAVHSVRFVPGELLVTGGDDRRLCVHETLLTN